MAQKRMFSLSVVDTDSFLEMPISSRLLYYELGMRADDDGFVNNWKKILSFTGLTQDDLKILITKKFVLMFENGLIVIRHWRLNNYLQKDRYHPTMYQEEYKKLEKDDNGVYELYTSCIPSIDKTSIDKIRLDKNSINKTIVHSANERECFEALWNLYPRKEGKAIAFKKYQKVRKTVSDEIISNGIKKYIDYIKNNKIEEKYIKMGSTWFNQECWNDEYLNNTKKGTDAFAEIWEELENEEKRNTIDAEFVENSIS